MPRDAKTVLRSFVLLFAALLLSACGAVSEPPKDSMQRGPVPSGASSILAESEDFVIVVPAAGDSFESLAAKHLGDAGKGWMIEEYNELNALTPGQAVVIPKKFLNPPGVYPTGYQLVPILCYHNIGPQAKGRLVIAAKTFQEQMRYLKANGFRAVSLSDYFDFLAQKAQLPRKAVVITFDDGYKSFSQYAYPVLRELGFTATLFVYTDYIGSGANAFSWADLKKLAGEGFHIEAHSKTHSDLRRTKGESVNQHRQRMNAELEQPKALFQRNLGQTPKSVAYPYGAQDEDVVQRAKELGYIAAFTVRREGTYAFVDPFRIHRSQIYSEMTLEDFAKNLNIFHQETLK